jgi:hypothetical protein
LYLDGCQRVTDAGLAQLDYRNAFHIRIGGTQASDKTLTLLAESKRLALAALSGTRVSGTGVENLKKAHPGCEVLWDAPKK